MVNMIPDAIFIKKDHSRLLVVVPTDPRSVRGKEYRKMPIVAMSYEIEGAQHGITVYTYTGLRILRAGAFKDYNNFF